MTLNQHAWTIWLRIHGCPKPREMLAVLRARLMREEFMV